jgi:DNA-binding response OmpR family regulator
MKILIAEDDPVTQSLVAAALKPYGYQLLLANTGDEAYRIIMTEPVDLLISDIRMSGGTGIQLLRRVRRIRSQGNTAPTVIIMTGLLGEREAYLRRLGACEVLRKPLDLKRLVNVVRSCLKA